MLAHYDFVNPDIMSYFSRRMQQAPRDANFALDYVKSHANTPTEREAVCNALLSRPTCYGFSSTRCIMPMSRATSRRAHSCPRKNNGEAKDIDGSQPQHPRQRGEPAHIAAACQAEIR
jgi:hypothetical protein